jgi:hypothetical protein
LLHITSGIIKEKPILLDFETKPHRVLECLYAYIPDWYQNFQNPAQNPEPGQFFNYYFSRFPNWVVLQ